MTRGKDPKASLESICLWVGRVLTMALFITNLMKLGASPSLGKHILGVNPCNDGMPLSLSNISVLIADLREWSR